MTATTAPTPRTRSPGPPRRRAGRKSSEEVAAASKDPALFEYVRRRDFGPEGTTEPAPGDVTTPTGNSFVIHKHRATRLHYDVRLGARRRRCRPGRCRKGSRSPRATSASRSRPRSTRSSTAASRARSPRATTGPARSASSTTGGTSRGVDRHEGLASMLHGRRYPGLEFHFVQDADRLARLPGERAARAADRRRPRGSAHARRGRMGGVRRRRLVVRTEARRHPLPRRALHRRDEAPHPDRARRHGAVSRAPHGPRVGRPGERRGRRRDRGVRRRRDELVRGAAAAHEPRRTSAQIERASKQIPGLARGLRPPLARRARDHRPPARAAARAARARRRDRTIGSSSRPTSEGDGVAFTEARAGSASRASMAKRAAARTYLPGRRSSDWRKIKLMNTQDCVILGWTPGQGGRAGSFGALLVGAIVDGELRWVGQVGTGFTDAHAATPSWRSSSRWSRPEPPIDDPARWPGEGRHVRRARAGVRGAPTSR